MLKLIQIKTRPILQVALLVNMVTLLSGCATPHGVPWTIQCMEYSGPNQTEMIDQLANALKHTPDIQANKVFTIHDGSGSSLYYGNYHRTTTQRRHHGDLPATMRQDLKIVRELGDSTGRHFFIKAMPVRMPEADTGNPQWQLSGVRAYYSLQVAAFEPSGGFWQIKQAAVEYCSILREKGYQAYYHHGPGTSVVTVGQFDSDAFYQGLDGRSYYRSEVIELQKDDWLKYNRLNGAIYRAKNDAGTMVPVLSRLVITPAHQSNIKVP